MALRFADHEFAALPELRWHPEAKRIRAFVGGATVVDSTRARIVWEPRRVVPSFAVPVDDIDGSLVAAEPDTRRGTAPCGWATVHRCSIRAPGSRSTRCEGRSFDIVTGTSTLPAAAFAPADADLDGYVIVDFDAFDEWREEDEVLVGHARDPFKTVDTRRSSRRVEVEIAGVTIADSTRSVMLFETYLPTRYYLPRDDVRMDLLVPSDTDLGLCLQGARPVLVGARRRHRGHGRGVELRGPAQLRHVGEGHDLLLQRAGGHQRRRRAVGSSTHPVVRLTPSPTTEHINACTGVAGVRSPVLRFRRRSCRGRRAWTAGRSARRLAAFRTGA